MINSYNEFVTRLAEVDCLIALIPEKPLSANVKQIDSLCRASIVLLCSHLEGFLQDLMEEVVEEINQVSLGFKDLPLELYLQHKCPKGHLTQNNFDSLLTLGTEIRMFENSNMEIKLNKKNFSKTEGNPTAEVINKLFSAFGIPEVLDTLNYELFQLETKEVPVSFLREDEKKELCNIVKYSDIIERVDIYLTQKRNGSGKKDRNAGVYNTINTLLNFRNNIAHGNKGIRISTVELIELKEQIMVLVKALAEKAESRINTIIQASVSLRQAAVSAATSAAMI